MNENDNLTSLGSSSYSFYLNVVVLNNAPLSTMSKHGSMNDEELINTPLEIPEKISEDEEDEEGEDKNETKKDESDGFPSKNATVNFLRGLTKSSRAVKSASSAVGNVAAAFVAKNTMLTRASNTLGKVLPILTSSTDLDLTIGKRFQQGPVIVLQVDLKPTALPQYIEVTKGKEASDDYQTSVKTLKRLGASKTLACLEKEVLPEVRRGLMEKFSDDLVRLLKEKESQYMEVECIPLEESEEARWLFTYMEFQSQMK